MVEMYGLQCVVSVARINNIVLTKSAMFKFLPFLVMYCMLDNSVVIACFFVFVFCFASCFFVCL